MVPPAELKRFFEMQWNEFYEEMCLDSIVIEAKYVVKYAQTLIRFLIPSYIFALGPIPDPALWNFAFTAQDVTDLYHGHCTDDQIAKVTQSLSRRKCLGFVVNAADARTLRHQMWTLAYSTHVLLWGLFANDHRLLNLLRANEELSSALDLVYGRSLNAQSSTHTCIHYLLEMRRRAIAARECDCANRPPWKSNQAPTSPTSPLVSHAACGGDPGKHHFYDEQLLSTVARSSETLERQIRGDRVLLFVGARL
jgi:hypothetical protein